MRAGAEAGSRGAPSAGDRHHASCFQELTEELGELEVSSDEEATVTTRVVRRRVIVQVPAVQLLLVGTRPSRTPGPELSSEAWHAPQALHGVSKAEPRPPSARREEKQRGVCAAPAAVCLAPAWPAARWRRSCSALSARRALGSAAPCGSRPGGGPPWNRRPTPKRPFLSTT